MLNYSTITDKDRLDGELYYLSTAEKKIQTAFLNTESLASDEYKIARSDWTRYDELCIKYDRENLTEKLAAQSAQAANTPTAAPSSDPSRSGAKYPPNSLGARLVTINFHFHPDPDTTNVEATKQQTTILTIPRTLDVYRVKGLLVQQVGRQWGLRPLDFVFELVVRYTGTEKEAEKKDAGGDGGGNVEGTASQVKEGEQQGQEQELEEIPDSTRRIGDWIAEGLRECVILVRPRTRTRTGSRISQGKGSSEEAGLADAERIDLSRLMSLGTTTASMAV